MAGQAGLEGGGPGKGRREAPGVVRELQPPSVARTLLVAQQVFQETLFERPEGGPGRGYLARRPPRPRPELSATAGLGYAMPGYSSILMAAGCPPPDLLATGMIDAAGREPLAGRVTFPWLSIAGRRVLGMGGRKLSDADLRPKYENSPDSEWFSKGATVYGLAQGAAAIHGAGWALVPEGPFDAIALWGMGWTNSAATVGAKVTLDQLVLIARLCDDIVVLLDGDEGGRRGREALARTIAGAECLPASVEVRTATLEGAKDPADASELEGGVEMVAAAVRGSLPLPR